MSEVAHLGRAVHLFVLFYVYLMLVKAPEDHPYGKKKIPKCVQLLVDTCLSDCPALAFSRRETCFSPTFEIECNRVTAI